MKHLFSILLLLFVSPAMVGREPVYIKLNKDAFFKLDASKVTEVNIVSVEGKEPDEWVGIYRHIFPIRDPNRIDTIIKCIRDANFDAQYRYADRIIMAVEITVISIDPNDTAMRREKRRDDFVVINPDRVNTIIDCVRKEKSWDHSGTSKEISSDKILFRTDEAIYFTGIGWSSEIFYGDWWISPELRQHFAQWGMFSFDSY